MVNTKVFTAALMTAMAFVIGGASWPAAADDIPSVPVEVTILDAPECAEQFKVVSCDELLGEVIIAKVWVDINHGGWPGYVHASEPVCTGGIYALVDQVPPQWNDVISSGTAWGSCNSLLLYENAAENAGTGGQSVNCSPNCDSVGTMNDKTSSMAIFG